MQIERSEMQGLRKRRLALGLSRKQFARRAGMSHDYLYQVETGRYSASDKMRSKIEVALSSRVLIKKRTEEEAELHEIWCKLWG